MIYIIIVIHGIFWLKLLPRPYATVLLLEMPLIFLVSGYAFALSSKKVSSINVSFYLNYAKSRLTRIIVPYFAYALVCASIVMFLSNENNYIEIILAWFNPLSYGTGANAYTLNWHLWFIPPFLVVTLALPLCKSDIFSRIPAAFMLILLCVSFSIASYFESMLTTPIFYFMWAFIGFKLGSGVNISDKILIAIALVSTLALFIGKYNFNADLDMQTNKFPPNLLFLVFSCIWVSLALVFAPKVPQKAVDALAANKLVSLFVSSGYTLYLWQGLGFSAAFVLKSKFDLNPVVTLLIAVVITIVLGKLASPIERIRWKLS